MPAKRGAERAARTMEHLSEFSIPTACGPPERATEVVLDWRREKYTALKTTLRVLQPRVEEIITDTKQDIDTGNYTVEAVVDKYSRLYDSLGVLELAFDQLNHELIREEQRALGSHVESVFTVATPEKPIRSPLDQLVPDEAAEQRSTRTRMRIRKLDIDKLV